MKKYIALVLFNFSIVNAVSCDSLRECQTVFNEYNQQLTSFFEKLEPLDNKAKAEFLNCGVRDIKKESSALYLYQIYFKSLKAVFEKELISANKYTPTLLFHFFKILHIYAERHESRNLSSKKYCLAKSGITLQPLFQLLRTILKKDIHGDLLDYLKRRDSDSGEQRINISFIDDLNRIFRILEKYEGMIGCSEQIRTTLKSFDLEKMYRDNISLHQMESSCLYSERMFADEFAQYMNKATSFSLDSLIRYYACVLKEKSLFVSFFHRMESLNPLRNMIYEIRILLENIERLNSRFIEQVSNQRSFLQDEESKCYEEILIDFNISKTIIEKKEMQKRLDEETLMIPKREQTQRIEILKQYALLMKIIKEDYEEEKQILHEKFIGQNFFHEKETKAEEQEEELSEIDTQERSNYQTLSSQIQSVLRGATISSKELKKLLDKCYSSPLNKGGQCFYFLKSKDGKDSFAFPVHFLHGTDDNLSSSHGIIQRLKNTLIEGNHLS